MKKGEGLSQDNFHLFIYLKTKTNFLSINAKIFLLLRSRNIIYYLCLRFFNAYNAPEEAINVDINIPIEVISFV